MTSLLLVLALVAAMDGDLLGPGRDAIQELDYERAVRALAPVADDESVDAATRARAHMLLAEARFGMAHVDGEARARAAFRAALALEPRIDFEKRDDVSPRLLAIFDPLRLPAPPEPREDPPPQASRDARAARAQPATPATPATSPPIEETVSGWWIASAGLAATAVVSASLAGAFTYRIYNLPGGVSSEEVRGTQAAGITAVVVASATGVAAVAASTAALLE